MYIAITLVLIFCLGVFIGKCIRGPYDPPSPPLPAKEI